MSTKNIDNSRMQKKESVQDTFSSPKASDGDGIAKFEIDDLYPERIERLGQYLSDTTSGITTGDGQTVFGRSHIPRSSGSTSTNSRTFQRKKNDFPIENEGATNSFIKDKSYEIEKEIFNAIGESNFEPEIIEEVIASVIKDNPDYQTMIGGHSDSHIKFPGHYTTKVLGPKLVEKHIESGKTNPGNRWAGIGSKQFPLESLDIGSSLHRNAAARADVEVEAGTSWKKYKHPNHLASTDSISPSASTLSKQKFWDEYFDRMSFVGRNITMNASALTENRSIFDTDNMAYKVPQKTVSIDSTQGSFATFKGNEKEYDEKVSDIDDRMKILYPNSVNKDQIDKEKLYNYNKEITSTYGQKNSWVNPFIPHVENSSVDKPEWSPYRNTTDTTKNPDPTFGTKETAASMPYPRLGDKDLGTKHGPQTVFDPNVPRLLIEDYDDDARNRKFNQIKSPKDFPTLRMASTRRFNSNSKLGKHRLSTTTTPSLMLLPKSLQTIKSRLVEYGIEDQGHETQRFNVSGFNHLWRSGENNKDIEATHQTTNRFTPEQVKRIEDQLEAEYMPFYIQDLRTNEIISFHAFLESIEDSYSAEWSAQKGFGRLEAAQIYGGGSRSIGCSFTIVPTSDEDFDDMYIKINKLTTLVYPQWSEGTLMQSGDNTFIQPFSQVPTASPLCRIRVGDLFKTNYSKTNMARMMGIGNSKFKYADNAQELDTEKAVTNTDKQEKLENAKGERIITRAFLIARHVIPRRSIYVQSNNYTAQDIYGIYDAYQANSSKFTASHAGDTMVYSVEEKGEMQIYEVPATEEQYLTYTMAILETTQVKNPTIEQGIAGLFSSENPIIKSFESTMGRGIAVAITSIGIDWKLNSVPWNLEPGHRAPRQCTISLGLIPIHDITPGLDHEGYNRAPIYTVGDTMTSVGGDAWHNNKGYYDLLNEIKAGEEKANNQNQPKPKPIEGSE